MLKKLFSYSPAELIRKVPAVVLRRMRSRWRRWQGYRRPTYAPVALPGPLYRYLSDPSEGVPASQWSAIAGVAANYVAHRFDFLGSGWVEVRHGAPCAGLEGHRFPPAPTVVADREGAWLEGRINASNLDEAQRLWQQTDASHEPIDWHLDFKSGFRWQEGVLSQDIRFGHHPGVDVKVPWELARMHHLPQLAVAYGLARRDTRGLEDPEVYLHAFRNQVLDFLATNPPGFGVNWFTAMMSGIRGANLVVAYDLFRAAGASFDAAFEAILSRSLLEHGRHTLAHLEWWDFDERNNHYLSNIVGLMIMAAYLPINAETNTWLAFAYRELVREVGWEFHDDGSGIESSTCYHAFSAEMVAWGTGFILALPEQKRQALGQAKPSLIPRAAARRAFRTYDMSLLDGVSPGQPFPAWYRERVYRMHQFLRDVTKPTGYPAQLGDNDSGRFLKLAPVFHGLTVERAKARYVNLQDYPAVRDDAPYWDEDVFDYRTTHAALAVLSGLGTPWPEGPGRTEYEVLASLVGRQGERWQPHGSNVVQAALPAASSLARWAQKVQALEDQQKESLVFLAEGGDLREGLQAIHYPDFGVYILRSDRIFLGIRCGPPLLRTRVGHPHEDQLGICLNLDGEDLIVDPGTYVYTALLHRRNAYKSAGAHFVPARVGGHQASTAEAAAFEAMVWAPAVVEHFSREGFVGKKAVQGSTVYRMVEVQREGVRITDFCDQTDAPALDSLDERWQAQRSFPPSVGYGKLLHRAPEEGGLATMEPPVERAEQP